MLFIRILPASVGAALLLSAAQSVGATETPLEMAVATGAHLFATATFGGIGRTCETCHKDGGKALGQLGDRKLPSLLNAAARCLLGASSASGGPRSTIISRGGPVSMHQPMTMCRTAG